MRRRILIAIVGVTILATAFLTVPLAIVVSLRARSESVRELERVAERVAADISDASLRSGDQVDLPAIESAVSVAVYLRNGTRIAGNGPVTADELVKATDRLTRQGAVGSSLVVTRPVVIDEQTKGVIWVAEKLSDTEGRVRRDILMLVAFDLAAIGIAAASGWFLSSRLVAPLELIRDDAVRLGGGDFAIKRRVSGVAELDATSQALSGTAKRLETALHREREFSANASHQLRTPLTALRLSIEGEVLNPRDDRLAVLNESLKEIDRLESTIATLLDVARRGTGQRSLLEATPWMNAVCLRWSTRLSQAGRTGRFDATKSGSVSISLPILDEITDILIDNALAHGSGEIGVAVVASSDSVVLTVTDSGNLDREPEQLFVRHDPGATGNGVGLALARSLAEGEGGRLLLAAVAPTQFKLVLSDVPIDPVFP